jgi:hypothetical protein
MSKEKISKIIKKWVEKCYGKSEVDNPKALNRWVFLFYIDFLF